MAQKVATAYSSGGMVYGNKKAWTGDQTCNDASANITVSGTFSPETSYTYKFESGSYTWTETGVASSSSAWVLRYRIANSDGTMKNAYKTIITKYVKGKTIALEDGALITLGDKYDATVVGSDNTKETQVWYTCQYNGDIIKYHTTTTTILTSFGPAYSHTCGFTFHPANNGLSGTLQSCESRTCYFNPTPPTSVLLKSDQSDIGSDYMQSPVGCPQILSWDGATINQTHKDKISGYQIYKISLTQQAVAAPAVSDANLVATITDPSKTSITVTASLTPGTYDYYFIKTTSSSYGNVDRNGISQISDAYAVLKSTTYPITIDQDYLKNHINDLFNAKKLKKIDTSQNGIAQFVGAKFKDGISPFDSDSTTIAYGKQITIPAVTSKGLAQQKFHTYIQLYYDVCPYLGVLNFNWSELNSDGSYSKLFIDGYNPNNQTDYQNTFQYCQIYKGNNKISTDSKSVYKANFSKYSLVEQLGIANTYSLAQDYVWYDKKYDADGNVSSSGKYARPAYDQYRYTIRPVGSGTSSSSGNCYIVIVCRVRSKEWFATENDNIKMFEYDLTKLPSDIIGYSPQGLLFANPGANNNLLTVKQYLVKYGKTEPADSIYYDGENYYSPKYFYMPDYFKQNGRPFIRKMDNDQLESPNAIDGWINYTIQTDITYNSTTVTCATNHWFFDVSSEVKSDDGGYYISSSNSILCNELNAPSGTKCSLHFYILDINNIKNFEFGDYDCIYIGGFNVRRVLIKGVKDGYFGADFQDGKSDTIAQLWSADNSYTNHDFTMQAYKPYQLIIVTQKSEQIQGYSDYIQQFVAIKVGQHQFQDMLMLQDVKG